jgi:tetratricopeptide (TPR) repeat protein
MVGDSVGIARSFSVIAKVEIDHNQFPQAISHLRLAASVFQKYRLPYELGTTWNDLGKAAIAQNHHEEALKYYIQAIDLWKTLDDKVQVQDSLSAYAVVFLEQKQYDKALIYLEAAISFTARLNKRADLLDLTYQKGLALAGIGKPGDAVRILIPTAQEAQAVGRTHFEIKCYEQIVALLDAAADKKQGDYYRQQLAEAKNRL